MATISSHTLNGIDGTHAGGIEVELVNVSAGDTLFSTVMDSGGRLSAAVDITAYSATDQYQLLFNTAAYWAEQGIAHKQLIKQIVLRFDMPDPEARYHMPLILSPNSYSVWSSEPEQ